MSATAAPTSSKKRLKQKGRGGSAPFLAIPRDILRSSEFGQLEPWPLKLLLELAMQFRGFNNGDFSATFKTLKPRGWNSSGTLSDAAKDLQRSGFIVKTRQGGKNRCNLYAVTWWPINDCDGKIECEAEVVPSHSWRAKKMYPPGGAT